MATLTDPASELAEIAERLTKSATAPGATFLAQHFGVEAWSTAFVKIIACIMERADLVNEIVQRSPMDPNHKGNALNDLTKFKAGFTGASLRQHWNTAGHGLSAMKDHGRPLQYLSSMVRAEVCYPKLSEPEVAELLGLIDAYLAELEQSEDDPEFVRQAIKDGLNLFKFQLKHIGWMGSGYALAAFREVMFVYEDSMRRYANSTLDPGAMLRGLGGIVQRVKAAIDSAQGWADTGGTVWKAYQLASTVVTPFLLTSQLGKSG